MMLFTFLVLAACAALTNAEFRNMKQGKLSGNKKPEKIGKKPSSSMSMTTQSLTSGEEPEGTMRYLKESFLTIQGLEPGIQLTPAETIYLEDLILMNLNEMDDHDIINGERTHHTILFSGNNPDRKLSTLNQHGGVDEIVFLEYTCRLCPDDEDDWVPPPKRTKAPTVASKPKKKPTKRPTKAPTKAPTMAPSSTPSDAPSVDFKAALKKAIGGFQTNLCKGAFRSPFFRLRKISNCHLK
jgi:hypothetical protein